MAIVFLAGGFRGFPQAIVFFFCFSYIQVYAFLWPSDVALSFFLHCLSCWLLHHQFSLFFLSPLPLLLSLFSLFSDVFFGGVISFRFYRFLGVACVVYFVLNLLPFGQIISITEVSSCLCHSFVQLFLTLLSQCFSCTTSALTLVFSARFSQHLMLFYVGICIYFFYCLQGSQPYFCLSLHFIVLLTVYVALFALLCFFFLLALYCHHT